MLMPFQCQSGIKCGMAGDTCIFTADEVGRRTTVRFRDWSSSSAGCFGLWEDAFISQVRSELESFRTEHERTTLAVDMSPVDVVPSSFLGILVSLHNNGFEIELLHPSNSVREALATTNLNRLFTVRD